MTILAHIQLKWGSIAVTFDVAAVHAPSVQDLANTFTFISAEIASSIELHAAFIRYCVDCSSVEDALTGFDAFCLTYGTTTCDTHVVAQAQGLDEAAARRVLRGYFSAWPLVNRSSVWTTVRAPALFLTGGHKGKKLKCSYMSPMRSCGRGKSNSIPLFPEITLDSSSYTYGSPTGLLNLTQFTQVALVTFAVAAVADMSARSLVQKGATFAAHSLGEYAYLAAIGNLFALEDILDVVFYRGLLIQSAAERDTRGSSQFDMVAVDPSRLGHAIDEGVLALSVKCTREHCKELLEVVNYNVRSSQYVVAASDVLATPIDSRPVGGKAAIPLPGIDVPFHSGQLLPGVDEFCVLLQEKVLPENVDYSALHLRYISNLTAVPFETDTAMDSADKVASLAATLLVELLAYKFASPIQWIDTQDVLFGKLGVRHLVEMGANPVLSAMATKTRTTSSRSGKRVDVPHIKRDRDTLDVVHAIVAHKTKRSLANVSVLKSVKTLVSGKPTLQNEIVGNLNKEFGSKVPDKAEDLSLQDLATAIGSFGGSLGKHTQAHLARLLSNKMPGDFSVAYAAKTGISYAATASSPNGSGSQAGAPIISSAEIKKQHKHIWQQIQVLARYAGIDPREGTRLAETEQAKANKVQAELDRISAEFGDKLIEGVRPLFDARKARCFDLSWNWVRQEAHEMIQRAIVSCAAGSASASASVDSASLQRLRNRSNSGLLHMLAGSLSILKAANDDSLKPAVQLVLQLHDACAQSLKKPPVYRELSVPTGPLVDIGPASTVTYSEVPRPDEPSFAEFVEHMRQPAYQGKPPFIHLKKQSDDNSWSHCAELSTTYYNGLNEICGTSGLLFASKTALITGCGRGSIGAEIVCGLLSGGVKVIVAASSYSRKTTLFYEDMYCTHGSRGSELIVVPFNQGSTGDVKQLVDFVCRDSGTAMGLDWDLDYVTPSATVSGIGSFATNLGLHSEFAQRIQLTDVLRILGAIKDTKERLGYNTRPSLVVLLLSPNHGNLGGDGLYGECKLGLVAALHRWKSESWKTHLSIAGAVIGWTRGTGLMSGNNTVAQEIERLGVRTFSTREMAFNILGLAHPRICHIASSQSIWADLNGEMGYIKGIGGVVTKARQSIQRQCTLLQTILREAGFDFRVVSLMSWTVKGNDVAAPPLAKPKNHFPVPRQYEQLEHLRYLQGMVNLDKVVVVTSYSKLGPHGNAETRREMEAYGEFSLEGCIELVWVMGLIKHFNGKLKATGAMYVGWVDAKTEEPVRDIDVKPRYEEFILAHTDIRLIEPELVHGYDPNKRTILREIQIEHDMEPFEATAEEEATFKHHGDDRVDIWENASGSLWSVKFLKGVLIRVPMALRGDCLVAALLPMGWGPRRYGIPEHVIKQVDHATYYTGGHS
ncbi:fatty acid synthase alpha subunit Lsd1 [Coemansia sp. BCRC 34301]|nr:fatty acid synthase alpha subunit Lsd1 [Coemansia sp. BCRC 34301]